MIILSPDQAKVFRQLLKDHQWLGPFGAATLASYPEKLRDYLLNKYIEERKAKADGSDL